MVEEPVFRIRNMQKSFGAIQVLNGVDLTLNAGAVTVLMGANGAGKSTLVKVVSGVYRMDAGEVALAGEKFAPRSPAEAIRAGVVTVHQSINDGVVLDLDVATNLTLDRLSGAGAKLFFNPRRVRREAQKVADRMGLNFDMGATVGDLSLADRQMVAIVRTMAHEPRVLILDEPTSSLSSAEANRLFDLIDLLRSHGVAILYISHRMSDIRRLADNIVSLRDGKISGEFNGPDLDFGGAVDAMLGRKISQDKVVVQDGGKPVFVANNLCLGPGAQPFDLTLGDGEIVAVTGLVGVGKSALAEILFGARACTQGHMVLDDKPYAPKSSQQAIRSGVFLVAKDRSANGIVPNFNIYENTSLPFLKQFSNFGIVNRKSEREQARKQISSLGIVCQSELDEMHTLSGGNQQKVMVARWLGHASRLLILDEPFQGVDIAARRDIANRLRGSAKGRATLVFMTELDEAFEIADRILVMSEHTIVGEHRNADVDIDRILVEISGRHAEASP